MDPSSSSTFKPTTALNKRTASSSPSRKSLEALLSASDRGSLSRSSSGRSNVPSRLPPPTSQLPLPLRPLPDHAYVDDDGLVHLAASDCDLFITFPVASDFEVWDIQDDTSIACPAYLYIMAKEPSLWSSASLSMPDITLVEIRCLTKRYQSHFSVSEKFDIWECKFEGVELPRISDPKSKGVEGDDDSPKPATTPGSISTEMHWTRTLEMPAVGKCCNEFLEERGDLKVVRKVMRKANTVAPVGSEDPENGDHQQRVPFIPGRGFKLKMWIPIPARLFLKKETRAFEIEGKVWIVPGAGTRGYHEGAGRSGEAGFVEAKTEMTVTHLRKERNMDFLF
ncbi:hypothetical protein EST38_g8355 [Candolleomyces aberdarensis]|uniref:Uncharacterized protein n=1 Tax=Candolleomyces aberdarensis TaxID=2316362 RepID=A0A4V1Q364_9AGAR|nr:hypothetical protein EST38_g8355 [Candolleomyces aberdarensis]